MKSIEQRITSQASTNELNSATSEQFIVSGSAGLFQSMDLHFLNIRRFSHGLPAVLQIDFGLHDLESFFQTKRFSDILMPSLDTWDEWRISHRHCTLSGSEFYLIFQGSIVLPWLTPSFLVSLQEIGNLIFHSLDSIQLPGVRQVQTNQLHFPYGFHRTKNDARVYRLGGELCHMNKSFA